MKRSNLITLFFLLLFSCDNEYVVSNILIDEVLESQNYSGEIIDLLIYGFVTICIFLGIGYIGNKKKN